MYCFDLRFSVCALEILLEGSVSQIFDLGLSFHFMSKTGNFWSFFKTCFSRLHKIKSRT